MIGFHRIPQCVEQIASPRFEWRLVSHFFALPGIQPEVMLCISVFLFSPANFFVDFELPVAALVSRPILQRGSFLRDSL